MCLFVTGRISTPLIWFLVTETTYWMQVSGPTRKFILIHAIQSSHVPSVLNVKRISCKSSFTDCDPTQDFSWVYRSRSGRATHSASRSVLMARRSPTFHSHKFWQGPYLAWRKALWGHWDNHGLFANTLRFIFGLNVAIVNFRRTGFRINTFIQYHLLALFDLLK